MKMKILSIMTAVLFLLCSVDFADATVMTFNSLAGGQIANMLLGVGMLCLAIYGKRRMNNREG
jgi:hypothetical protein